MPRQTKSDVESRVLEAAKQVFFAHGFHSSSLRAIAKKAGTSESGVLRFYESKLHLLQCVFASCWADINARMEKRIAEAAGQDPDPRHHLLQLMRLILEDYYRVQPMMYFMLSTFGFEEPAGYISDSEDMQTDADSKARREYRRYLTRIHDVCDAVVAAQPVFAKAGISGAALAHIFLAMARGIQGNWYAARLEPGVDRPQLTIDEALRGLTLFLYAEAPGGTREEVRA
jgi:AcrR family transcriptional regulator